MPEGRRCFRQRLPRRATLSGALPVRRWKKRVK